ncbi:MAG: ion transporter, partial [Sedimenticolaceae bacterium]
MNSSAIQASFERLRSKKSFELFVVSVIIASALLVGAKTYEISTTSMRILSWLDILVTLIFL